MARSWSISVLSSVSQTAIFAAQLQARGASSADAPIARYASGRSGWNAERHGRGGAGIICRDRAVDPLLCYDVTNCGGTGAGQVTKILNNMVLFETVNALAEAVAVAKRNGVDPALLLDTLSKGSADSFALRNHGLKAIVSGIFPSARSRPNTR